MGDSGTAIPTDTVCAIIVTFLPRTGALLRTLAALAPQVQGIVLVDNGSPALEEERLLAAYPDLVVRRLGSNIGIAGAQNEGLVIARARGYSYVLLLDQDSVPEKGMVEALRESAARLKLQGHKVACIGPRIRLQDSGTLSSFVSMGWFGRRRYRPCEEATSAVECDTLIASGTLIPLEVIDAVGGMEEAFFIDQVDTEWCLRARARGFGVFGACGAVLEHSLGESTRRFWAGRWRNLPQHKPFRYYYIFRNTILLARRAYVPWRWTFFNAQWLALLLLLYGLRSRGGAGELRMMLRGALDGLRGVTGKLAE